jgi:hypothetical protein
MSSVRGAAAPTTKGDRNFNPRYVVVKSMGFSLLRNGDWGLGILDFRLEILDFRNCTQSKI